MSQQLANAGIVARMKDYFERQLAWFEVMREEIGEIEAGIDPDQLEHLLEEDGARVRSSKDLEREFLALKSEWDQTEVIPDCDVEDVKVLAREAERLANDLQRCIERASLRAGSDAATIRDRMGELRQGRDWLSKYRPDASPDAGILDHQA